MAFFGITIEKIAKIEDHPNADRLSLAQMEGLDFTVVIGRNQFKVGDEVLYFPIDALLPLEILEKLNLVGKLSGSQRNRVKTIFLRGVPSQGIVAEVSKFLTDEQKKLSSEEITKLLGIEKYEPPQIFQNNGILEVLPNGLSPYDIEGCERNRDLLDLLMEKEVVITEKMEGTNFSIGKISGKVVVNQRNYTVKEKDDVKNTYWEAARKTGLMDVVKELPNDVFIYGELCGPGIQNNIYGLRDHKIFVFDIKKKGSFLDWKDFSKIVKKHNLEIAPILYEGPLKDFLGSKKVSDLSNGKSVYGDTKREGIVVKPKEEIYINGFGRVILKQRSPAYLADEK